MENIPVYCGNNRLDLEVQSGRQVLGTRHKCLKKGFGTGYYVVAPNRSLILPYEPLVNDKFYCGNRNALPNGYTRFGTLSQCFSKGVGAGMRKKATEVFGVDAVPGEVRINIPNNNYNIGYNNYSNYNRRRPDVGIRRKSTKKRSKKKYKRRSTTTKRKSVKRKRKRKRRSKSKKRRRKKSKK